MKRKSYFSYQHVWPLSVKILMINVKCWAIYSIYAKTAWACKNISFICFAYRHTCACNCIEMSVKKTQNYTPIKIFSFRPVNKESLAHPCIVHKKCFRRFNDLDISTSFPLNSAQSRSRYTKNLETFSPRCYCCYIVVCGGIMRLVRPYTIHTYMLHRDHVVK